MANEVKITINAEDNASDKISGVGKVALGIAAGIGAAAAGVGVAATSMAIDFDKGMREVNTLINLPEAAFKDLKAQTLDLSKTMGVDATSAVKGLYQALSAGVPKENAMEFLKVASKAAIGGVTSLEVAVDGITSAVNAFGPAALSAEKASDLMFTTVRLGKTNFEQLSASLFQVAPTAATLGIKFEEVTASLARMTLQGVPTSVATTQLRAAMVEASKGGTKLNDAIKEMTGSTFQQLIAKGVGFVDIMQQVRVGAEKGGVSFNDLFGSVEGLNAVLALTGPNFAGFNDALKEMQGSTGATNAAFEEMEKSVSREWEHIKASLYAGMIDLGSKVLPMVSSALAQVAPAMEGLGKAAAFIRENFDKLLPGLLALAGGIIGALVPSLIAWTVAAGAAAVATWAGLVPILIAAAPFILIGIAIGLVIAAVILLVKHWDEVKAKALELGGALVEYVVGAFNTIVSTVSGWGAALLGAVVSVFETVKGAIAGAWDWVVNKIREGIAAIGSLFTFLYDHVGRFKQFVDLVSAIWTAHVDAIKLIWETISTVVGAAMDAIGTFLSDGWSAITTAASSAWDAVSGAVSSAWSSITSAVGGAMSAIGSAVSSGVRAVIDWFAPIGSMILSAIGDLGSLLVSVGSAILEGLWNGMKSKVDQVMSWIRGIGASIKNAFVAVLDIHSPSRVMAKIGEQVGAGLVVGMKASGPSVTNAAHDMAGRVPSAASGARGGGGAGGPAIVFAPAFHGPVASKRGAEDWMVEAFESAVRHGRIRLAGA